jgi:hypothetical protein
MEVKTNDARWKNGFTWQDKYVIRTIYRNSK